MAAPSDAEFAELARALAGRLGRSGRRLATAESCTGGWIAKACTDLAGSSEWFVGGTVAYADLFSGYANLVIVEHGTGAYSLYGHLSGVSVRKGDRVEAGTAVGTAGRNPAGNPSTYFELRVDDRPVDPLQWLKR